MDLAPVVPSQSTLVSRRVRAMLFKKDFLIVYLTFRKVAFLRFL